MPEIVGQPWTEHGRCCVQVRIPREDGSNLETVVRLDPADLTDQPDDVVAARLADAVAAEVDRHAAPTAPEVPAALTRVLADPSSLSLWERGRVRA
jgi:hypothetical protein